MNQFLTIFSIWLSFILPLLISIAIYTLAERKLLSSFQRRLGPNVVGIWGILQPLADGLKLLIKSIIIPRKANKIIYIVSPLFVLFLSFLNWIVLPISTDIFLFNINGSILFTLTISSLAVYGIIFGGWSSNSTYALLGALRSTAQMISYEVGMGIILVLIIFFSNSLNYWDIIKIQLDVTWFIFPLFPLSIIFLISILAETNRAPFDLPEAESELVAGYNVEYSGMLFAFFFLGEYNNMLFMSQFFSMLMFAGGSFNIFLVIDYFLDDLWFTCPFLLSFIYVKLIINILIQLFILLLVMGFFILVRATLPRYKYNQLMELGWKVFLPITLTFTLFIFSFFFAFNLYYFNDNSVYYVILKLKKYIVTLYLK